MQQGKYKQKLNKSESNHTHNQSKGEKEALKNIKYE